MKINSGHSRRDFLATIGTLSAGMTLIPLCAGATDEIDPNVASIVSGTMGIDTHNHIDVPLAAAEVPGPNLSIINYQFNYQFNYQYQLSMILGVEPVQSLPLVPWSHPFVERLVGSIRRELLDHMLYWNARDLERKLELYRGYFNASRVHQGLDGDTPEEKGGALAASLADLADYRWQSHCHGLVQLPTAA